jgi:hypothetical protein
MKTLKEFFRSSEASLCASFLQNAGIEATVFEDSAFGDALDSTKSAVRIVVPDEQFAEAEEVLKDYQLGDDVEG